MAGPDRGRGGLEARLEALSALRGASPEEAREPLSDALRLRTALVVARAAEVTAAGAITELLPQLEAALDRFLDLPAEKDRRCVAKTALAAACDDLGSREDRLFARAARCVQLEAYWGGREDTATAVRIHGLMGLVRLRDSEAMNEAARLLADPEARARAGAARALANGSPLVAVPLLRHKTLAGDANDEVTGEALASLLALEPEESVGFVAGFLDSPDETIGDAAALALGDSRLDAACDALTRWARTVHGRRPQIAYTALACLRLPRAFDALLDVIRAAPPDRAVMAVEAMAPFREDQTLAARTRAAAKDRPQVALACDRAFPK